ncbi:trypsin-like isoform X2 [Protopterus annectens]|uniref:trypsin-like isoform X2 n=1 Tax=Protopterus annectens TaxID=7888 RepID=UPI001CF9FAB5|nr:trypsin-like isoform X2 [Protopterus annectens]
MKLLLLAAILGATAAAPLEDRIINGYECQRHSRPWQVFISFNGNRWCGGSLINQWWIVSAAHCYQANTLLAWLGDHDVSVQDGTEQYINVAKVIAHPNYNADNLDSDIMLIKLAQPAVLNQYVQTILLPRQCVAAGTWCIASGWGNLITDGVVYPNALQCLNQPIISDDVCRSAYPPYFTNNMMCSGFMEGGQSTCQGDSGGPLECNGELHGVVSWGYQCAMVGHPSVFVKVCRFIDWINNIITYN